MRILVTGALGYLGHAVTHTLATAGHDVVGLTHRPDATFVGGYPLVSADLLDRSALVKQFAEAGPFDGVCHLAALTAARDSFQDPLGYYDVNVGGTINLLTALTDTQQAPVRAVFASTGAVYGGSYPSPLSEDLEPRPTSPYAASKHACEQLLAAHAATGAIGSTVLRVFNIAGVTADRVTDTDPTRLIPAAIAVAAGVKPSFGVNGDGSVIREFTHVHDVADAFLAAIHTTTPGESRVYNVGSGTGVSIAELLDVVRAVSGRPVTVQHNPPRPEPAALVADTTRTRDDLNWKPTRSDITDIINDIWAAQN